MKELTLKTIFESVWSMSNKETVKYFITNYEDTKEYLQTLKNAVDRKCAIIIVYYGEWFRKMDTAWAYDRIGDVDYNFAKRTIEEISKELADVVDCNVIKKYICDYVINR